VMHVASKLLEGRVALAAGDQSAGISAYREAVGLQDKLIYDEPPAWPWPVREHLGAALLAAGDAKSAQEVFAADLVRNPKNPRSLLGLSESLHAQGKRDEAHTARREFEQTTERADVKLAIGSL
jgi:predicted Zn-dependent protease